MKRLLATCLITVLFLTACSGEKSPKGTVAAPTSPVKVITVAPTATPLPSPSPTPVVYDETRQYHITSLSGDYDVAFPYCFDTCVFETGEGYIRTLYTSSTIEGVMFAVTSSKKDVKIHSLEKVSRSEVYDDLIPASYFEEGAEGVVTADLTIEICRNDITSPSFDFKVTYIK